jgi:hypothetical protein
MTEKGVGTRAWLGAMLSAALSPEATSEYPVQLLLADLEQLGHIEQSTDRSRWWLQPTRWIRDRAHLEEGLSAEMAVGARDYHFWGTAGRLPRVAQPREDRPPKMARPGPGTDDWALELAQALPTLPAWIIACPEIEAPSNALPPTRFTAQGTEQDLHPSASEVATWRIHGRDVFAAPTPGGRRAVPRGVARIIAAGGLPYAYGKRRLAIPRDFQPPLPYRRVLTLCSGLLPAETADTAGTLWLVFDGVDGQILSLLQATLPLREIP